MINVLKEIIAITFPLYIFLPLMLFTHYMTGGEFKESYTQDEIIDACLEYKRNEGNRIIDEYQNVKNNLPDPESTGATHLAGCFSRFDTRQLSCCPCLEYKRNEGNRIIDEYQNVKNNLPDPESTGATHLAIYYNGISSGIRAFNCFTILRIAGG